MGYNEEKKLADWKKEQLTALAISTENPVTGEFCCSDERLNQLQSNIYWSQRSNNITISTDCPTREKAGWTGLRESTKAPMVRSKSDGREALWIKQEFIITGSIPANTDAVLVLPDGSEKERGNGCFLLRT